MHPGVEASGKAANLKLSNTVIMETSTRQILREKKWKSVHSNAAIMEVSTRQMLHCEFFCVFSPLKFKL